MTKKCSLCLLFLASIAALAVGGGLLYLHDNNYWFFGTGTDNRVFLNSTFEMSPPEVERAIGRNLMTYGEYRSAVFDPIIEELGGFAVDREYAQRKTTRYMSRIMLFGTPCAGRFEFFENKLHYIQLHFRPVSSRSQEAIEEIHKAVQNLYRFRDKQESSTIVGAYTLKYKNDYSTASLWYNPAPTGSPVMILRLYYPRLVEFYKSTLSARDKEAF